MIERLLTQITADIHTIWNWILTGDTADTPSD